MLQLQIENCNKDNAEQIIEFLEEAGAVSVTMLDQFDDPILEPELGTMPLWPTVVVNALYDPDANIDFIKQTLNAQYEKLSYSLDILPDEDWEKVSLESFKPHQIGERLLICPSWISNDNKNLVTVTLDPGLAFGTGAHPTTSLCLAWLEKSNLKSKTIIDYGCGSGILAITALKLGAKHAYAVDLDDQALLATRSNARANAIKSTKITVLKPEQMEKPVDIIVANILLNTLSSLKQDFIKLLNEGGVLVLSGVLASQVEELTQIFSPEFAVLQREISAEWSMLALQKKET